MRRSSGDPSRDRVTALLTDSQPRRRSGAADPPGRPLEGSEDPVDDRAEGPVVGRTGETAGGPADEAPARPTRRSGVADDGAGRRTRRAAQEILPAGGVRLPGALDGAMISPPWRAVLGAAVLVVLAVAAMTWRVMSATAIAEPVETAYSAAPTSPAVDDASTASPSSTAAASHAPASPPPAGAAGARAAPSAVVHVIGRVKSPGVVTVPAGARVQDAITAAGGPVRGADLAAVNLARRAVDGEQILVPAVGEVPVTAPAAPVAPAPSAGSAPPGAAPGPIDLNTADQATLETLPGVGPVLAQRILQWREDHGRFSSVDELAEVNGVGEKRFAELAPRVRV